MTTPTPQIIEPVFNDVLIIPTPGVPGKDGKQGVPGKDGSVVAQETMRFTQNNPAATWVIEHKLPQPISACHVVSGGEPIMVSWMETQPGQVQVFFNSPCSGEAVIS